MNIHCSYCDIFSTTSERQAKCETCHADVSYKCELCNKFLPSYSDLQLHVFNVHIMDTEMSLENKNEMSEDIDEKHDSDEINYSGDSNGKVVKQCVDEETGDSINYKRPNEQKSEKGVQRLNTFDKFVKNLKEKRTVTERRYRAIESNDSNELTDESNNEMNKVSIPMRSEDASTKIHDDTLSDIVNSNVTKDKTCDSQLNEKCLEDRKDVESSSSNRKCKSSGIKRYCLRCDRTKKDINVIRIGHKKEICEKCRSELLYQCVKCKRKSNMYSVMLYHWKNCCAFLRPKYSTFAAQLNAPEKYKTSNIYNRKERHQCRLCPYSSNLKNRLMLHLQMHSWKDIKNAVLKPENRSNTLV